MSVSSSDLVGDRVFCRWPLYTQGYLAQELPGVLLSLLPIPAPRFSYCRSERITDTCHSGWLLHGFSEVKLSSSSLCGEHCTHRAASSDTYPSLGVRLSQCSPGCPPAHNSPASGGLPTLTTTFRTRHLAFVPDHATFQPRDLLSLQVVLIHTPDD